MYYLSFLFLIMSIPLSLVAQETETIEGKSPIGSLNIMIQETELLLDADFQDENGNLALDAEENATIAITVSNKGPGKVYNVIVSCVIKGEQSHVSGSIQGDLGTLKAGMTATTQFHLTSDEYIGGGTLVVHIEASEKYKRYARPIDMSIETRALIPPALAVSDFGIDDDSDGASYGNSNGKIEKGETIEVKVIVQNKGSGLAENVVVDLTPVESVFFVGRRSVTLGDLGPGEFHEIDFAFTVPPSYKGKDVIPFKIDLSEKRKRYGKMESLEFVLNREEKRTDSLEPETIDITATPPGKIDIDEAPILTVDVDINIPRTKSINKDAVAVVIGNRNYQYGDVPRVDYAIRDAAVIKEYLVSSLGYQEGNILYFTDATSAVFRSVFGTKDVPEGQLAHLLKTGRSDVFIYYSGHGAPNVTTKQAYFIPIDCHPGDVQLNGYPLDLFYENLSKLEARSITIAIDACFSGGSQTGMLIDSASPIGIRSVNPAMNIKNATIFVSSSGDEISSWYPEKKHGLFTYFFLKGLQGSADDNLDDKITASELNSLISDQNEGVPYFARRLYRGRQQTPQFIGDSNRVIIEAKK
jgi:hypothetical protein